MGSDPPIRPALPEDVADIGACVASAYEIYIARIGKPPGPMLEDYGEVIRRHRVFVLEHDGRIAGVVVLVRRRDGLLLDNVAVRPEHQGRGYGCKLIAFAEAEARRQGFRALELYTHERMTENIEMYRRLGYVETERRQEHGYDRVYMRKLL